MTVKALRYPIKTAKFEELVGNRAFCTVKTLDLKAGSRTSLVYNPRERVKQNLVLVHGLGHSPALFDLLAEQLCKQGIRVISIGLAGHHGDNIGLSAKDYANMSLQDYANDATGLILETARRFSDAKTAVLGHSMGGLVTLLSATHGLKDAQREGLINGLVLLSSAGSSYARMRFLPKMVWVVLKNIIHFANFVSRKPISFSLWDVNHSLLEGKDLALAKQILENLQPESWKACWQILRSALPTWIPFVNYSPTINIGRLPVLNIYSMGDELISHKTGKDLTSVLSSQGCNVTEGRLDVGHPHNAFITDPKDVSDMILRWQLKLPKG